MKKWTKLAVSMALLLYLSSCVIWSVNKFYTKNLVINLKELRGKWKLFVAMGDKVEDKSINYWVFKKDKIYSFDKKNRRSDFKVTYFKIGDTTFADVIGSSPKKENAFWIFTVVPMHILLKVELAGKDQVTLTPMNYKWFYEKDNAKVKDLPYIKHEDNSRIYTCTPEQWVAFLKENLSDPEMFNSKHKFMLKRVVK